MIFSPLLIITLLFSTLYFIMVMYFFIGWLRLKKSEVGSQKSEVKLPFVSIIIPVRNESENIQTCIASIFSQAYPENLFEVIVIDDYSTDSTLHSLREMSHNNLFVLDLMQYLGNPGNYFPNKKKAIALGIKNAKGDLIITTDGDCKAGEIWLISMVNYFQSNKFKLITGPVMMKPAKFPLEIFQQLDVMNLVGITGATLQNNFPTMCNGANLMYSKETFLEVEGFKGNHDVPTGDDVFLMQKINERYPNSIGFIKNFDACVFTKPERGLGRFFSQRIRWISKSSRFTNVPITLMLYFAYLFNLLIVVNAFHLLQPTKMFWLPLAIAGGTKFLADLIFNIPITIFFRKPILLLAFPIVNLLHVLYVIIIGVFSLRGKYRWKDRIIK